MTSKSHVTPILWGTSYCKCSWGLWLGWSGFFRQCYTGADICITQATFYHSAIQQLKLSNFTVIEGFFSSFFFKEQSPYLQIYPKLALSKVLLEYHWLSYLKGIIVELDKISSS